MKTISTKHGLYVLLIILLIIVTAQNSMPIDLKFFVYSIKLPLILIIAFAFFAGYLTAILFAIVSKKDNDSETNSNKNLEE